MGCGASGLKPAPNKNTSGEEIPLDSDAYSIIVWAATALRDADWVGISDPYCVARLGPKGSAWSDKNRSAGRRSESVANSSNPEWKMGFVASVKGIKDPELHVRVYDKDLLSDDDFIGEATRPLQELVTKDVEGTVVHISLRCPMSTATSDAQILVSAGPKEMLQEKKVKPAAFFEQMAPIGVEKSIEANEITGKGPLLLGGSGLPFALQGIFWLTNQGKSSALASFGGPNRDGGGCSVGRLIENRYKIRVSGDRVWAFAESSLIHSIDLVYHFVFDDAVEPTRCQIYPESRNLGIVLTAEFLLDFEMELKKTGDKEFPGSVAWRRVSSVLGQEIESSEYVLVQIIDGNGKRIEPAWSKFIEYQNSDAAGSSSEIFYRQIG